MMLPSRSRFIHRVDVWLYNTEATDYTGSLNPQAGPLAVNVPCLVMDKGGGRMSGCGREYEKKHVRVLFCDSIDLKEGNFLRYTTPAGKCRKFLVNSFRDDQDMGRLWVAECDEFVNPTP